MKIILNSKCFRLKTCKINNEGKHGIATNNFYRVRNNYFSGTGTLWFEITPVAKVFVQNVCLVFSHLEVVNCGVTQKPDSDSGSVGVRSFEKKLRSRSRNWNENFFGVKIGVKSENFTWTNSAKTSIYTSWEEFSTSESPKLSFKSNRCCLYTPGKNKFHSVFWGYCYQKNIFFKK